MVDLHSRLAYFTSLVRQTSVHNMVDSFYFTWVDSHQTSVYTQQTRIFYFTCSLDICSQYGRAFCSLLVLAYFTSLGQTRIRDMFTIWQTCTVDSHILLHFFVRHLFTIWQTLFTSLGQTRIRHLFTHCRLHILHHLFIRHLFTIWQTHFTYGRLVLLHLGRLALDICSQNMVDTFALYLLSYILLHSFYFTWVDLHQISVHNMVDSFALYLGRLALNICSQYGRLTQQTCIFYFTCNQTSFYGRLTQQTRIFYFTC